MLRRSLGLCLCVGALASEVEDGTALVQAAVRSHSAASAGMTYGRVQLAAQLMAAANQSQLPGLPPLPKFDCGQHPKLCEAPFNCRDVNLLKFLKMPLQGLAPDGKADLQSWCLSPQYESYIHTCLVGKDLVKAAHIQYEWSVAPGMAQKEQINELDGSYCFIEGHCTNDAVTNETTLEDATQMCDERYGREGWSLMGSVKSLPKVAEAIQNMPTDNWGGFRDTRPTNLFLKLACAMGNYHCDVMYCKETYCKNPYYVKKYSHLLPKAPGHLLQSRDWLP